MADIESALSHWSGSSSVHSHCFSVCRETRFCGCNDRFPQQMEAAKRKSDLPDARGTCGSAARPSMGYRPLIRSLLTAPPQGLRHSRAPYSWLTIDLVRTTPSTLPRALCSWAWPPLRLALPGWKSLRQPRPRCPPSPDLPQKELGGHAHALLVMDAWLSVLLSSLKLRL